MLGLILVVSFKHRLSEMFKMVAESCCDTWLKKDHNDKCVDVMLKKTFFVESREFF